MANTKPFLEWTDDEVYFAYPFGCSCGESYNNKDAAIWCKKCRIYLTDSDFASRSVTRQVFNPDETPLLDMGGKPVFEVVWTEEKPVVLYTKPKKRAKSTIPFPLKGGIG